MGFRDRIQREFVIFMLSITIEKEDFAFIKPDGIHIQAKVRKKNPFY